MKRYRSVCTSFLALVLFLTSCNMPNPATPGGEVPAGEAAEPAILQASPTQTLTAPTATLTPTPAPSVADDQLLAVVLLPETNTLNLHAEPGESAAVVASLDPRSTGLTHQGALQNVDGVNWLQVAALGGASGWADTRYLTAQVDAQAFCLDGRLNDVIARFAQAVQNRDGAALAQLSSPTHGLRIRHEWWNPEVVFATPQEIAGLFNDETQRDWGLGDGSGLPIQGAFKDIILPGLDDVVGQATQQCNTLEQGLAAGGTAGFIEWPFEYANFNYLSLYRAAAPGDDLNWRTWAIGVEFVAGQPYIVALVQYHWEI